MPGHRAPEWGGWVIGGVSNKICGSRRPVRVAGACLDVSRRCLDIKVFSIGIEPKHGNQDCHGNDAGNGEEHP